MPLPVLDDVVVLVTGGAGFIGSHLVDALLERGARVRVLDDFSTGKRENLAASARRIELLAGDLRDAELCRQACSGVRLVFHQAALGSVPRSMEDPATSLEVNVQGTAHLLAAARRGGVARVVYASSSSVYGASVDLPKVEGREDEPLSPYALSKRMGEDLAALFGRCYGLETVGLRYFNVYGPRQDPHGPYAAVIPLFFKAGFEGVAARIHGDGEQSRDFTFVGDAVAANLLAAGAPAKACGRAYNVGAGKRSTVNHLAEVIRELTDSGAAPQHVPPRPGDVPHSLADLTAVRAALGYEPRTGLRDGLAASYDYYRATFAPVAAP